MACSKILITDRAVSGRHSGINIIGVERATIEDLVRVCRSKMNKIKMTLEVLPIYVPTNNISGKKFNNIAILRCNIVLRL